MVRPGGSFALFHPIGRAALAARHGRQITPDDLRAEPNLRPAAGRFRLAADVVHGRGHPFPGLAVRQG